MLHGPTDSRLKAIQNCPTRSYQGMKQFHNFMNFTIGLCFKWRFTNSFLLFIFQTVLPSKVVRNEKIMETLMVQANSGIYRVEDSYLDACKRFQRQESSGSKGEWTTYEMEKDV